MNTLISTTARATDDRHLELRQPLQNVPDADLRVLIFLDTPAAVSPADRTADFLDWAHRPRPAVGLSAAGRDVIYED